MSRAVRLGVAVGLTALLLAGCGNGGHATSLPGLTHARATKLNATVRGLVASLGTTHHRLSSITVFATHHQAAASAVGHVAGFRSDRPVYLVVARGHFWCAGCAGSAPATANVMTFVFTRDALRLLPTEGTFGGNVNTDDLGPGVRLPPTRN